MAKKVFGIFLGFIFLFAVAACAAELGEHYRNLRGLVNASTAFNNEISAEQTITLSVRVGDGEIALNYDFLLDFIYQMIHDPLNAQEPDMYNILLELQMRARMDEDLNLMMAVDLPLNDGAWKPLLSMYLVDENMYIGVHGLRNIFADVLALSPSELGLSDFVDLDIIFPADYFYVSLVDTGLNMFMPDAYDFDLYFEEVREIQEFADRLIDVFTDAFIANAGAIILEDLNVLSSDDDWYVLSFNQHQARIMLEVIFQVIYDSVEEYIEVFQSLPLFAWIEPDADEIRAEIATIDFASIEDHAFDVVYRARLNAEEQYNEVGLSITVPVDVDHSDEQVSVQISVYSRIQVKNEPLQAPQGRTMNIDDFLGQPDALVTSFMDGFMFGSQVGFDLFQTPNSFCDCGAANCDCGCVWGFVPACGSDVVDGSALSGDAYILMGTVWAWDMDAGYVYAFNNDGTLTRGFPIATQTLRWNITGTTLRIYTPGFTERWTFEIVNDVLTITSQQVSGMQFSYIRQHDVAYGSDVVDGFTLSDDAYVLIGTVWAWDMDAGYVYTFNNDGTLTRGFPGAIQTLRWNITGTTLRIYTPGFTERWTFEIVDDVLTITSQQVSGMQFSYILQYDANGLV